jgi:hypothetical protein
MTDRTPTEIALEWEKEKTAALKRCLGKLRGMMLAIVPLTHGLVIAPDRIQYDYRKACEQIHELIDIHWSHAFGIEDDGASDTGSEGGASNDDETGEHQPKANIDTMAMALMEVFGGGEKDCVSDDDGGDAEVNMRLPDDKQSTEMWNRWLAKKE